MQKKTRLLLVDDEHRFVDSLEGILKHFDYQCKKAYSGAEAIQLLEEHSFEIALLDVELPDISGLDIARLINTKYPATTVIMLTGVNTVETAVTSMKYGAYDFLNKPLDHKHLLKTLEKATQYNTLTKEFQVSEQRFQILSEVAWECIMIHSDGKIIESNCQLEKILGYTPQDIARGLTLENIISPSSSTVAKHLMMQGIEGSYEAYAIKKDGSEIPIEAKSRSITYLNQKRKVCVIRDMSERLQAEEEKLRLQQKLASASKLNALGLMAGSIAHDLNNILSGIVSYPDLLLLQMDESDQYYAQIQKIQAAGKRAASVVSDLVTITRGQKQPKIFDNPNDIVLRYLNSLEHGERLTSYHNVNIQTKLQKTVNNICCSPQHLHKLLLNLVGNAMEAIQAGGTVKISTENCLFAHPLHINEGRPQKRDFIKLVIADDGPGISPKDAEHIFDPFYTTKVMGKSGSGLGLSIVWNIVQEHGGWIELKDNNPGAGFEIYLPASKDQACTVESMAKKNIVKGDGENILIIDDQADQNEVLEKSLTNLGYVAHSVTSGEKGVEFLKNQHVDLILLDMIMGDGLNGRETLEIIRANNPQQKAIIISGYSKLDEIEKTKALGISSFLEKPITISNLSNSINTSLSTNIAHSGCIEVNN